MNALKSDTTVCVDCPEILPLGQPATDHYRTAHADNQIPVLYVSLSDTIALSPNLTIKPLGQGMALVALSCGCGARVCYNTAACPGGNR